jgi:4-hydroxybenzoate polyprenyltransferase
MNSALQSGRRTFPIAVGEHRARVFLAVGFTVLPVLVYLLLVAPTRMSAVVLAGVLAMTGLNLLTAYRVLRYRDKRADHLTYLLFAGGIA